jgi:hypothetical protein
VKRSVVRVTIPLCAVLLVAISGCGSPYQDKVVGTWDTTFPGISSMTFNKDGTGKISLANGGLKSLTWRLQKSNNMVLKVEGEPKELGFLIQSADENKIVATDPAVNQGKTEFYLTKHK